MYSVPRGDGSSVGIHGATIDDLIDAHVVFAGTPDQVFEQIKAYNTYVGGCGHLLMMGQGGNLSHEDTVASLKLFSREVLPRLAELSVGEYEVPPAQIAA